MSKKIWSAGDELKASELNSITTFGGDGSDGDLSISSGTTNIDCANASLVVKNYTSISITGTGKLTFSNPHANGTVIILKSRGNVVLTSTTVPCIDLSAMGASGGVATSSGVGNVGSKALLVFDDELTSGRGGQSDTAGAGGIIYNLKNHYTVSEIRMIRHSINISPGSGGGSGAAGRNTVGAYVNASGAGGKGGGALLIECGGALNFTGTISVNGEIGETGDGGVIDGSCGGSGGGGGAGMVIVLYNSLTSKSGTVTTSGGAGGAGATKTSGAGGGSADNGAGGGGAGVGGAGGAGAAVIDTTGGAGGSAGASSNVLVVENYYFA